MNFGAIQEYEANTDIMILLLSRDLKLRFMNIPNINDRRFLVFIEIPEISYFRFKSRNLIKINFVPKIDIRIDNESAIIIDSLLFAPINDIPLLFIRFWNKKKYE
jgi:hypothetical protein